jgi:hypothetical protein
MSSTLPSIFAQVTSPYLEELDVASGWPGTYDSIVELTTSALSMWKALDRVLSAKNSLRTVRLTLGPPFLAEYVKRGLSLCDDRGILYLERAARLPTGMFRLLLRLELACIDVFAQKGGVRVLQPRGILGMGWSMGLSISPSCMTYSIVSVALIRVIDYPRIDIPIALLTNGGSTNALFDMTCIVHDSI